jgi:hypothetical protein
MQDVPRWPARDRFMESSKGRKTRVPAVAVGTRDSPETATIYEGLQVAHCGFGFAGEVAPLVPCVVWGQVTIGAMPPTFNMACFISLLRSAANSGVTTRQTRTPSLPVIRGGSAEQR